MSTRIMSIYIQERHFGSKVSLKKRQNIVLHDLFVEVYTSNPICQDMLAGVLKGQKTFQLLKARD